jgi:3' terminal RNA ribose 2'-O-methyltransferase Hen1
LASFGETSVICARYRRLVLLTITTTHQPATDLGYLLRKNPERTHSAELSFGTALVFFPVAEPDRCCAALLVEVDPVALAGSRRGDPGLAARFALQRYLNDRPYAASSLLSVALAKVFSTAMSGRSRERPELAGQPIPVEASLPVLPCRGGEPLARRLFEPLGYQVRARPLPLDPQFPGWGDSEYLSLSLTGTCRLRDLLEHLYVLLPVLDDGKHYWVGSDEVAKLVRRGGDWLAAHPEQELIASRYLHHDIRLTGDALARLCADEASDPDRAAAEQDAEEDAAECRAATGPRLADARLAAVAEVIAASGARRVLDLGCGEGRLIAELLRLPGVQQVTGVDVSHRALQGAARRLGVASAGPGGPGSASASFPSVGSGGTGSGGTGSASAGSASAGSGGRVAAPHDRQRDRVQLLHGSLTYLDGRLRGYDAAAAVEVIEHVDPARLGAFERCLFGLAQPGLVVLTTPNAEYNELFATLPAGSFRHRDHRFEWTRAELAGWAGAVAARNGYRVTLSGVGPADPDRGSPTQLAVFRR